MELVDVSQGPIDISGWSIVFMDASCEPAASHEIPAGESLRAGQHYLVVNGGYTGPVAGDDTVSSSDALPEGGGAARLVAPSGTVDTAGYGLSAPGCTEGSSALEPPPGVSAERVGGRQDTDDNRTDFLTSASG